MVLVTAFLVFTWGAFLEGISLSALPDFRVSQKELECYSQEKIYHKPTDKCYKLLTTGPCPRGHWFVLEKPKETTLRGHSDATIRATCVRENCREGEYYWSRTRSCVQGKDKKHFCGDIVGEELLNNVFGEGECVCARNPPRARLNGDKRNRCYPLYTQGPCPAAHVLGYVEDSEQAICIPDPCYSESTYRRRVGTLPTDGILAPSENGTCYELGTQGPCPDGLTFKIHPRLKKPKCESLLNQIFGGLKSCDKDVNGACQKKVMQRKRSAADKYMKELQKNRSRKVFGGLRNCVKDENGVCQQRITENKKNSVEKFKKELQEALAKKI